MAMSTKEKLLAESIKRLCSKDVLNVRPMREPVINKLVGLGRITTILDMFTIRHAIFDGVEKFTPTDKETVVQRMLDVSHTLSFAHLLYVVGIAENMLAAEMMAKQYQSLCEACGRHRKMEILDYVSTHMGERAAVNHDEKYRIEFIRGELHKAAYAKGFNIMMPEKKAA